MQQPNLPESIFDNTIGNCSFVLYSPEGLRSAVGIEEQLSKTEFSYFELLAEIISQQVLLEMKVPYSSTVERKVSFDDSGDAEAYAVHVGSNHFVLCAREDYFNGEPKDRLRAVSRRSKRTKLPIRK